MRELVLDTETTGLDQSRDRIIEIGIVEMIDGKTTGETFHHFIFPERPIPRSATRIHGITDQMVFNKPKFAAVADDLLGFLGKDPIVAHNAFFDIRFLNKELARCKKPPLDVENVVDTLAIARKVFPGSPNSLDALCKRYKVDTSKRVHHGALLDAQLLSEVYIELTVSRQGSLELEGGGAKNHSCPHERPRQRPEPLPPRLTAEDIKRHEQFIKTMPNAMWRKLWRRSNLRLT